MSLWKNMLEAQTSVDKATPAKAGVALSLKS